MSFCREAELMLLIEQQRVELAAAREALVDYGYHSTDCADFGDKCDCGWKEIESKLWAVAAAEKARKV